MKKFLVIVILFSTQAYAQDSLDNFNRKRNEISQTGMKVLGGWAIANIAVSSVAFYRAKGASKYFNQMNIFWNIVNLGFASAGFYGAKEASKQQLTLAESIREQHKIEKILLLNAGLDVAYVAGGFYLHERGINKSSNRLRGYGNSIILQGAFLLLFDSALFVIENHHSKKIDGFLQKVQIGFNGKQIGLTYKI